MERVIDWFFLKGKWVFQLFCLFQNYFSSLAIASSSVQVVYTDLISNTSQLSPVLALRFSAISLAVLSQTVVSAIAIC